MSRRDDFLRGAKVMRLATSEAGGPHVAPVWYVYESGRFYAGTSSKSRKARNAARNPLVGFCVDVGVHSPDIYGVAGQGTARVIRDSSVRGTAEKILLRYFDGLTAAARELLDATDCIIEITPTRMWEWS